MRDETTRDETTRNRFRVNNHGDAPLHASLRGDGDGHRKIVCLSQASDLVTRKGTSIKWIIHPRRKVWVTLDLLRSR